VARGTGAYLAAAWMKKHIRFKLWHGGIGQLAKWGPVSTAKCPGWLGDVWLLLKLQLQLHLGERGRERRACGDGGGEGAGMRARTGAAWVWTQVCAQSRCHCLCCRGGLATNCRTWSGLGGGARTWLQLCGRQKSRRRQLCGRGQRKLRGEQQAVTPPRIQVERGHFRRLKPTRRWLP
jgi:hypothetical protein